MSATTGSVTITKRFVFFWSGWPSQWYPSAFEIDEVRYGCCEQFMMAEKARVFGDHEALAAVMATSSPREQKAIGRRIRGFQEGLWNSVCRGIVYRGNLAKFEQSDRLRNLLLATGKRTIVEASPVDSIWGIGLAADHPDASEPSRWIGRNWLGIAVMQVRDQIAEGLEPDAELLEQLGRRRAISGGTC